MSTEASLVPIPIAGPLLRKAQSLIPFIQPNVLCTCTPYSADHLNQPTKILHTAYILYSTGVCCGLCRVLRSQLMRLQYTYKHWMYPSRIHVYGIIARRLTHNTIEHNHELCTIFSCVYTATNNGCARNYNSSRKVDDIHYYSTEYLCRHGRKGTFLNIPLYPPLNQHPVSLSHTLSLSQSSFQASRIQSQRTQPKTPHSLHYYLN